MRRFEEKEEFIEGIFSISKKLVHDERGHLERLFCLNELRGWGDRPIAQVNKTFTAHRGTVRGFHFQKSPHAEAKFVCCLKGKVTDFALDLRRLSKTFGEIFKIELDANLRNAVILPEGVAHGFQTLTDDVEMLYFHSQFHAPEQECGVNILDASLKLNFELDCTMISEKDKKFKMLQQIRGLEF